VTFTGWLDEGRLYDYLSTADLGLDSNLQPEVSPVKGMEYMAFGLPLVAFDLRETRAMAEGAAAYVPPGDAAALAWTVMELLDDPERRAAMGDLGRCRIEDALAWDRQAERYLAVYERVLGQQVRNGPRGAPLGAGGRPRVARS
jgi:glycosyltransferase involved in cell wall biosynthesis